MAKPKAAATGSSIVKWDEEMAKDAAVAVAMEANTGGGKFLSVKGGILSWNDSPIPGNEIPIIILDHIFENVMYTAEFDADNPSAPDCFAFGRDEKELAPHEVAVTAGTAQEGPCATCKMNVFGSADKGRGKACRNIRRLGLIPAGSFNQKGQFKLIDDPEYYEKSEVGFLKVSLTSVKGFAAYVKQVAAALKRPPHGIITRLKVVPDPKSQHKMVFEPIVNVPDKLMGAIMKRREEVKGTIDFPYSPMSEDAPKPAKGKASKGKKAGGRY